MKKNEAYIQSLKKVLTGDLDYAKFNKDSIMATPIENVEKEDLKPSDAEIKLREEVAAEEKTKLPKGKKTK